MKFQWHGTRKTNLFGFSPRDIQHIFLNTTKKFPRIANRRESVKIIFGDYSPTFFNSHPTNSELEWTEVKMKHPLLIEVDLCIGSDNPTRTSVRVQLVLVKKKKETFQSLFLFNYAVILSSMN